MNYTNADDAGFIKFATSVILLKVATFCTLTTLFESSTGDCQYSSLPFMVGELIK